MMGTNHHEKNKEEEKPITTASKEQQNPSSSSYASFLAWMYSSPALKENHSCTNNDPENTQNTQCNKKEEANGIPHFSIRISDLDRRRLRHVEPKKRAKGHESSNHGGGGTCWMPHHPVLRELLARFEQKEKRKIICHSIQNFFDSL